VIFVTLLAGKQRYYGGPKGPTTHDCREIPSTGRGFWDREVPEVVMVPVMWTVWGALVVILASIWVYRARLERDEEDQIFIDDAFSHERTAQAAIVERVNKVQPIFRSMLVITAVATVFVIGYYVYDIIHQF
jgi:hypothetical protein